MKILTVVGARPQFVKAAVLSRKILELRDQGADIIEEIIHTGQHYDDLLSNIFFEEMEIPQPAANLEVGSGNHGKVTGLMLAGLEAEMFQRKPDLVLIYGDTNSTLAGALAAAKLHIPIAHVEAGLRSYNRKMPEEINRIVADQLSTHLFCPTQKSVDNLNKEGLAEGAYVVGDIMVDAVLHYRRKAIAPEVSGDFALATIHRAENTESPQRLKEIIDGLAMSPCQVLLPLHPRTRQKLNEFGIVVASHISILDPVSYFEMLGLLEACQYVITDSGGLQKEAYVFGKKCVTVRDETEWVELVESGWNMLVGAEKERILSAYEWIKEPAAHPDTGLYGNGESALKICNVIGLLIT